MLHLDNKEYDLNTLFSFEVLKEILLKLSRAQINLEEKVQNFINEYQNKGNYEKEKEGNYFEKDENLNIKDLLNDEEGEEEGEKEEKISKYSDNKNIQNNEISQKENIEQFEIKPIQKNYVNSEIKEKNVGNEKEGNLKENDNINLIKDNNEENGQNGNEKEIENNNIINNDKKEIEQNKEKNDNENNNLLNKNIEENKESIGLNKAESKNEINNKNNKNKDGSSDLITNMLRAIKENKDRIALLEMELKKEKEKTKKNFKYHEASNINDFQELKKILNELTLKLSDCDKKIENCEIKCSNFDFASMFKDNGNGSVDATKIMVKSLEDKIFKKFEMIDERNKKEISDNININNKIELLMDKINRDRQDIEKLYNMSNENKELIKKTKNDFDEKSNEIEKNLNKKIEEIKNLLNKKIKDLNEKMKNQIDQLKNIENEPQLFKLNLNENQVDKEVIDDINLKINNLRKKVNDIDNSLNLYLKNDKIEYLDNEIQTIKLILGKKISKDDLKDLYNLHLSDLDEINDTKNKISLLFEQVKRANSGIQILNQKLENLSTNFSLLQDPSNIENSGNGNNTGGGFQGIIDFSKFIDNQKLVETVKPLMKEMEKMFREVYSLRRDLEVIQNLTKEYLKQENLDKFEGKMIEKLNDLKNIFQKKYIDKAEYYKTIKNLESQIKTQVEENKKDAESWLMAKRPLRCFNCASCESNIKNTSPSNEYLPWNKYPPSDKIYRMGQGFSHMLQMMTTEFVNSVEKNAKEAHYDNEQNQKTININNIIENKRMNTNTNSEKTLLGLSINKRQQFLDDSHTNGRKSGKMRLPIMSKFMKNKKDKNTIDIPVSDDENDNNDIFDKFKIIGSPKILKIMKKKGKISNSLGISDIHDNNMKTENNIIQNNEDVKDDLLKNTNFKM